MSTAKEFDAQNLDTSNFKNRKNNITYVRVVKIDKGQSRAGTAVPVITKPVNNDFTLVVNNSTGIHFEASNNNHVVSTTMIFPDGKKITMYEDKDPSGNTELFTEESDFNGSSPILYFLSPVTGNIKIITDPPISQMSYVAMYPIYDDEAEEETIIAESGIYSILNANLLKSINFLAIEDGIIENIDFIVDIPFVKSLYFSGNRISFIPDISALTRLENLDLSENPINSLAPIANHPAMKFIHANNCPNLTSINEISTISTLESVSFYGCTSITTLPDLGNLSQLWSFSVQGCTSLTEIAPGFRVPNCRFTFDASDAALSESKIDQILQAFVDDTSHIGTGGRIFLNGSSNGRPSAAGLANINTLISRGWSVTVNN